MDRLAKIVVDVAQRFRRLRVRMAAAIFCGAMMRHRNAFVISPTLRIRLPPIWGQIYWLILTLTIARSLANLYCFVRPAWSAARSWVRLALDAVDIIVPLALLRGANWVDLTAWGNMPAADVAKITALLNSAMQLSLILIPAITLIDVYRQARLLWRTKRGQSAPLLTVS